jgi:hypothetical protein
VKAGLHIQTDTRKKIQERLSCIEKKESSLTRPNKKHSSKIITLPPKADPAYPAHLVFYLK